MSTEQSAALPWANDSKNFIGCNYAYGYLAIHLPKVLEVNGRLHAETYIAGCGAIAGFAAQRALLAQNPAFRVDDLKEDTTVDGLFLVRGPRGERFIFGEPLKEMIFLKDRPATATSARLWEWASGAAGAAGLNASEMPDAATMWSQVTRAIKDGADGMPSVPREHHPHLAPMQLLEHLWPFAKKCLSGRVGDGALAPPELVVVEPRWWPTITGMVTNGAILKVKDVLAPRTALTLAIESAILTLKIDPTRIERG
jgi:hypothetical protein